MFHSRKFRLLTGYLAFWLLGTTILSGFPTPVQAGFSAFAQATTSQAGDITGTPKEGSKAVSLTSQQIGLKISSLPKTTKPHPILPVRSRSGQISKRGPTTNIQAGQPGLAQAAGSINPAVLSSFPALDFSFPGNTTNQDDINKLPTQLVPPDTMGAAGPSQYVMAINGMLRVFTKATGAPEHPFGATDPDLDTFFASVMTPVADGEINYTTFPRLRYDRNTMRWFILVNDVPGGGGLRPNRVLLAVSSGSVITSATTWNFFYFQLTDFFSNSYANSYADSPTLGIDANALYIGVNLYDTANNQAFTNTAAFVVRKSTVLGAGPIFVTGFAPLMNPEGPFSPQGVDNLDSSVSDGYFIGVNDNGNASATNLLQLRRVTNPGGTPSLSQNIPVTVPDIHQPVLVTHKGGGTDTNSLLDPGDNRLINAVIHNGSLWTAHNIGVNNTGASTVSNDRDGSRWYEITLPDAQASTPTLRQSGTVFDNTSSLKNYWVPSLTVSGQGYTVMGLNVAGPDDYISAAFTGRLDSDSLNTMRSPVLYQTSTVPYTPANNPGNNFYGRSWGYYSLTSLDPEDNMTFWTIQEYAYNSNGYGIQIAKIKAPPPANIVSANPSFVISGQSNVDITVTGSSSNSSGFYEPGPDFSKHLTASASGGVTVNSVTYVNPTTIKVNVSALGGTPGQYDLNITNPDGQIVTGSNLINVTCSQVVSDAAADGATGSLRDAVNNTPPSGGCISLQNVTHPIVLTGSLVLPAGINITSAKPCSAGKVEIIGNGFTGDGLTLNGGNFFGIYVHGFKGRQIVVKGHNGGNGAIGPNKMTCVKASTT